MPNYIDYKDIYDGRDIKYDTSTAFIEIKSNEPLGIKIIDLRIHSVNTESENYVLKTYRVLPNGTEVEDPNLIVRHHNNFLHASNILVSPSFSLKLRFENAGYFYGEELSNTFNLFTFTSQAGTKFIPLFEATYEKNRSFSL